eukprot:GEMP01001547.1.p1 GENE.GEMP01001547.1~~GEMP01001547.1.p1  ORF type:complete len:1213 (+),score=348.85 GEMP01001547.1:73-3711(+)
MSKVDFRSTLQRKLDISVPAIATKLKSELRFELIRNLRSEGLHLSKGSKSSLQERAYFSIVLDFLKRREFLYTLSVFLPECGAFANEQDILARHEILHTLGIPEDKSGNDTYGMLPVLEQLTAILRREYLDKPQMVDRMQQTIGPANLSLDEKLRKIELERPKESSYRGLEEKLVHFQQECDRRSRQELEAELRRIRTLERQTVRLEEADRARRRHEQMETELRREYELKDEQLRRKEEEALDRLRLKEGELQRREGELRQETLRQMDELQKQNTLRNSSLAVEEERVALLRRGVEEQRRVYNEERDAFMAMKQSVEDAAITRAERRVADDKLALEQWAIRQRGEQQQFDAQMLALRTREAQQERLEEQHRRALDESARLKKEKEELEERRQTSAHSINDLKRQLEVQIEQCRVDRQDRERLQAEVLLQQANERSSQSWRREEERRSEQALEAHRLLQAQVENFRTGNEQLREEAKNIKCQLDDALKAHASQIGKTRVDLEETWNLERRSLMGEVARVTALYEQAAVDRRNLRQDIERSRDDVQLKTQELRKLRDVLDDHLASRLTNKENVSRNEQRERPFLDVQRFLQKRDSMRRSSNVTMDAPFQPYARASAPQVGATMSTTSPQRNVRSAATPQGMEQTMSPWDAEVRMWPHRAMSQDVSFAPAPVCGGQSRETVSPAPETTHAASGISGATQLAYTSASYPSAAPFVQSTIPPTSVPADSSGILGTTQPMSASAPYLSAASFVQSSTLPTVAPVTISEIPGAAQPTSTSASYPSAAPFVQSTALLTVPADNVHPLGAPSVTVPGLRNGKDVPLLGTTLDSSSRTTTAPPPIASSADAPLLPRTTLNAPPSRGTEVPPVAAALNVPTASASFPAVDRGDTLLEVVERDIVASDLSIKHGAPAAVASCTASRSSFETPPAATLLSESQDSRDQLPSPLAMAPLAASRSSLEQGSPEAGALVTEHQGSAKNKSPAECALSSQSSDFDASLELPIDTLGTPTAPAPYSATAPFQDDETHGAGEPSARRADAGTCPAAETAVDPLNLDAMFEDSPKHGRAQAAAAAPLVVERPLDFGAMFADSPTHEDNKATKLMSSASETPVNVADSPPPDRSDTSVSPAVETENVVQETGDGGKAVIGEGKQPMSLEGFSPDGDENDTALGKSMNRINEKVETVYRELRASKQAEVEEVDSVHSFSQAEWSGADSNPSSWD